MDFIDWRKVVETGTPTPEVTQQVMRRRSKGYHDYIEELIREAQERGEFSNLPGSGKPLQLDDDSGAGDNALGYHLLKNNGFAPAEVELAKEIRKERERIEAKLTRIVQQGKALRSRRVPPFASEKRAFNHAVEKAVGEYDKTLRELNRKILTLSLTAPAAMHQPILNVESLVQAFRVSCPLFEDSGR